MLDDRIKARILDDHQRLNAEGKLLSRSQLDDCYRTVRARFGPDVLSGLDGEELLETMHSHGNKDSLVYWLEFKNDEEFPARFGSISGGSALKFGIFRSNETRAWMTGSPRDMREVPVPQAVEIARRHRDELIRGAERVGQVPERADDSEYRRLQDDLDQIAPTVGNLAWGHKYLSLLAPERLDDYHNADYQRFHLIKMLQLPPDGNGRYLCAGRYVAAAHELDIPLNHLTTTLNHLDGEPHSYWRIGTTNGQQPRNRWPLMRDGGCVAIGWPDLGDLSGFEKDTPSKERLIGLLGERYPDSPQQVGRKANQILNFVKGVMIGDTVLACDGQTVLGVGRISGDYLHESGSDFPHRRPARRVAGRLAHVRKPDRRRRPRRPFGPRPGPSAVRLSNAGHPGASHGAGRPIQFLRGEGPARRGRNHGRPQAAIGRPLAAAPLRIRTAEPAPSALNLARDAGLRVPGPPRLATDRGGP